MTRGELCLTRCDWRVRADDGGLKQSFQLQAMDVSSGQPLLTLQSDSAPEFWLTELEPGSTFTLYLYAANGKGLSAPVVLPASTLKEAAKRTVPPSTDKFSSGLLGAAATGVAVGVLLLSGVGAVACVRCRRRGGPPADGEAKAGGEPIDSGAAREENGGFREQQARGAEKRARLKVPPAFVVNMSDVPESCV